jgi:hypothetical protein
MLKVRLGGKVIINIYIYIYQFCLDVKKIFKCY